MSLSVETQAQIKATFSNAPTIVEVFQTEHQGQLPPADEIAVLTSLYYLVKYWEDIPAHTGTSFFTTE